MMTETEPEVHPALQLPAFSTELNLRQRVAHALRAALVAGEMRPGSVYSAPMLADKFGVSATPVREAMLDLVSEGLVETVRNKGFRVRELTNKELDDVTDLRMLIEVPSVAEIARRCAAERLAPRLEALRPCAHNIEKSALAGKLVAYIENDRRFHLTLLSLLGNDHLVEVVANLRARTRLYGLHALAESGALLKSAREHEQLIELVLAGDAPGSADLMRQHIGHVRGVWAGRQEGI